MRKVVKLIDFKKNPFNYLKQADIFILTSKYEGLPNVLLEALVLKNLLFHLIVLLAPKKYYLTVRVVYCLKQVILINYQDKLCIILKIKKNANKC